MVANTRHPQIHQPTTHRNARADTAVRPYAESPESIQFIKSQRRNAPRGGMLSASAGRRKCSHIVRRCQCVPATSARVRGTYHASAFTQVANTGHPQIHQPTTHRNARADTAVRPYAEIVLNIAPAYSNLLERKNKNPPSSITPPGGSHLQNN